MTAPVLPTKVSSVNATLPTISYQSLLEGDIAAREELTKACLESGFFYLDCRSHQDGKTVADIDHLFDVEKATYDLPMEVKRRWAADKDHGGDMILGYEEPTMVGEVLQLTRNQIQGGRA
jgi:isopenicillin N synthase-like dioxygenase